MSEQTIELKLVLEQANVIAGSLGKVAYEEVADLITNLQEQAAPQVEAVQAAVAEAVEGIEEDEAKQEAAAAVDRTITLNLTTAETNTALQAMGQMPYVQVAATIQEVMAQGRPQAEAIEASTAEVEAAADAAG